MAIFVLIVYTRFDNESIPLIRSPEDASQCLSLEQSSLEDGTSANSGEPFNSVPSSVKHKHQFERRIHHSLEFATLADSSSPADEPLYSSSLKLGAKLWGPELRRSELNYIREEVHSSARY
jgi:hypothetical protein